MTDHSELKRLAEACPPPGTYHYQSKEWAALMEFQAAVEDVYGSDVGMAKDLIAEVERLSIREDVLENLCDARFRINLDLETERDKLKAENEALRSQVAALQSDPNSWQSGYDEGRRIGTKTALDERGQLRVEVEALRKDAERYRWLRNPSDGVVVRDRLSHLIGDHMDSRIDSAMSKGDKP